MDLLVALLVAFTLLLIGVLQGIFIAYPLLGMLGLISLVLLRRGFSMTTLLKMGMQSSRKAFPVFSILLLIGIVTATWMAAGTVPAIVYYGIQLIHPHGFILTAFLLTSLVSLLLGTSFGAAGTIGIALMIMAKGSGVNLHLLAGAVIAGAYLGDRCSPMSSSAHLITTLTQTDLYLNLRNMVKTGWLPFGIASLLYAGLSLLQPVQPNARLFQDELERWFNLNPIVLLPAITLLTLAVLRVEVKRSMLISIAVAVGLALGHQHHSLGQLLRFALVGFQLEADTPLQSILRGGGLLPMLRVCAVVVISTAIAGLLSGSQSLQQVDRLLQTPLLLRHRFGATTLVSLVTAAFGCSQTIAILLTEQFMRPHYPKGENGQLALDLENTAVVLAPLVPWNIAGLVPATLLMTDWRFIPYAFYLYLIPVLLLLQRTGHRAATRDEWTPHRKK